MADATSEARRDRSDAKRAPTGRQDARSPSIPGVRGHAEIVYDARAWSRRHVLLGAALWVVAAVILALLSVAAHSHLEFPGDVGLATLIQALRGTFLEPVINFASQANWPRPAGIIAIVTVVVLAVLRHFRAALCAAVAGFGADLANVALNGLVARPRPHNVHIHVVAHLGLHSFPSGHVTHVIGFYGFLLYLTFRVGHVRPSSRPWLWPVRAICLYFMLCIGPSRVLEGEHWPSDVLASYLLGALVLALAVALYHLLAVAWLRHLERLGAALAAG